MQLWHLTPDTPCTPQYPNAGEQVTVRIGTYPIEDGQTVGVTVQVFSSAGEKRHEQGAARWQGNEGNTSYWEEAAIGPFADADRVIYSVHGRSPDGEVSTLPAEFTVGPKIHLTLLWPMHQPLYRDLSHTDEYSRQYSY